MFRNKKFLFVESILFILLVVFAFKIGWRETYASLNQLTGLGTGSWVKIDVTSDGGTIVIVNSSGDTGKVSSNSGSSVTITGPSRNWADVYEAGGNFIAVSNSTGDYVHTFDGNSWNEITTGPMGPFNSAAMSDDQNYKVVTRGGSDYYDYYYSNNWSSGTLSDNWQDSAMSSNGQYTLLGSASGAYVNSEFSPGNVTVRLSSISITKVAMSDDGQHMLALASGGTAYYSVDYGASWSALPNKTGLQGVDVSNAGVIVAIKYSGGIYYTKDYGVNWLTIDDGTKSWLDAKINDQGTKIYAIAQSEYVYSYEIDTTAPSRSGGSPSGDLGDGETSATLQVTTNENATCRYSTESNTDYNAMAGTFDSTGSTTHSEQFSGLQSSSSFTYYVRCEDVFGNINADDYSISFYTVSDTTPPEVSGALPNSDLLEGATTTNLQVTTNENATCRYATSPGEAFPSGAVFTTTGGTSHSVDVTGLAPGSTNTYYVRCQDSNLNQSTSDTVISFSIPANEAPEITNITSDRANGTYSAGEVIDIDITFSEPVDSDGLVIYLNTGDQCSTGAIINNSTATCNYNVQSGHNTLDLDVTSISGSMSDAAGNTNSSFSLESLVSNLADNKNIVIDNTAPVRSSGYPSGVQSIQTTTDIEIGLTTDETATCRYSTSPGTAYGDMTSFSTTGGTSHTYLVENVSDGNSYTYYVRCSDNYGHENNTDYEISFSAQEPLPDSSAPTITSVSSDKADGSYTVGEVVDIDVTFSEAVTSFGGVTVTLETGDTDRTCTFNVSSSTSGTCNYTVQAGDTTSDLNVLSISGSIEDGPANAMVDFTPATNLADNKNIIIDTTAPSISSPLPSGVQAEGTTGVTLQVSTDENATCKYGNIANTAYASISNTFSTTGATTHTQSITGLSPNTTYAYYVRCSDGVSNVNSSDTVISFSIPESSTTNETQDTTPEGSSGSGRTGTRNTPGSSVGSESNNSTVQIVDSVVKRTVKKIDSVLTEFKETVSGDPENKSKILELIEKLKEEFNKLFNRIEETQQAQQEEQLEENVVSKFTQDLEFGDTHPEVKLLQQFLNNKGYLIASTGPGSIGNETETFGSATRAALIRFQKDNNIMPAVGNFGPMTRNLVNSLLN